MFRGYGELSPNLACKFQCPAVQTGEGKRENWICAGLVPNPPTFGYAVTGAEENKQNCFRSKENKPNVDACVSDSPENDR